MTRRFAIAALAAALAGSSGAEPLPPSVFGLELGRPLALPECAYRATRGGKNYDAITKFTCYEDKHELNGYGEPVRRVNFKPEESPVYIKWQRLFALEADGMLIGIDFLTPGVQAQEIVLAALRQKFGEPTTLAVRKAKTLQGAEFDSLSAVWALPALIVRLEGTTDRIDTGRVTIDTPAADALRQSWDKQREAPRRTL
ncbi:MAG: hypothetical protein SHS37scaffold296_33 [Burkholderiales phage 68_11]|jgi:hypothetical protein|nr:MAG: hypothetical protein SHS37scaffold296_33 [Burkholderiales phage 68_11]